jgi:hypothetical protein
MNRKSLPHQSWPAEYYQNSACSPAVIGEQKNVAFPDIQDSRPIEGLQGPASFISKPS